MEEIYVNIEEVKPVNPKVLTNHSGPRSSEKSSYLGVTVFLGLLSVLLLAGLIVLGVHHHHSVRDSAAELSALKDNMTAERDLLSNLTEELERLSEQNHKLHDSAAELSAIKDNLTAERDLLSHRTKELESLSKQKKTCPAGWKMFSCSCYFLSKYSGSWDQGRQDCRNKGADLVVIDSSEEQKFLSDFTNKYTWIGLNDREVEGTWKWVDGTPLTLKYWAGNQPDNGGGDPKWGEEDCVHIRQESTTLWNDASCATSLQWICEKMP